MIWLIKRNFKTLNRLLECKKKIFLWKTDFHSKTTFRNLSLYWMEIQRLFKKIHLSIKLQNCFYVIHSKWPKRVLKMKRKSKVKKLIFKRTFTILSFWTLKLKSKRKGKDLNELLERKQELKKLNENLLKRNLRINHQMLKCLKIWKSNLKKLMKRRNFSHKN